MTQLDIIRKTKSLFMKWKLHKLFSPLNGFLLNLYYMNHLSKWRATTTVKGYNDWYRKNWDYSQRYTLYESICKTENLDTQAIDYFEFGVCEGHSFKWWLQKNNNNASNFYGFDTFEGLPEKYGFFEKGTMAATIENLNIQDTRASFYKGVFQETLVPFLSNYQSNNKKLIHMDADIFSATIFSLSQLYRFLNNGDVIMFDEFAVPKHEFMAFKIFTESFYLNYEVIAATNNYLFLAIKIIK